MLEDFQLKTSISFPKILQGILQIFIHDLGIVRDGADIIITKSFLHHAEILTPAVEISGKAMVQNMGAHAFILKTSICFKYGIAGLDQFYFQLLLIDVFDKNIISYHLGLIYKAEDSCRVLKNALAKRALTKNIDLHIDR